MNQKLEYIITELNPINDFRNVKFYELLPKKTINERIAARDETLNSLFNITKSYFRGAILGSIIGCTYHYIFGDNISEEIIKGAIAGFFLDGAQYHARWTYHFIKEQFSSINKVKNQLKK